MHLEWLGRNFNMLDCPGYADFVSRRAPAPCESGISRSSSSMPPTALTTMANRKAPESFTDEVGVAGAIKHVELPTEPFEVREG